MKQKIDFVNEDTGKALLKMVMPLFMAMNMALITILVLLFSTQISLAFVREAAVAPIVSRGLKIIGIGYLCYMAIIYLQQRWQVWEE